MSSHGSDHDDADRRPKLLVCLGAAWPGNDASGPNRSFAAFAATFAKEFDITLLARATPFGKTSTAPSSSAFVVRETHHVRYLPVGRTGVRGLVDALRKTPHDILLLNGFFDREFTIPALVARSLRRIPRKPVILSPRGEFSGGALSLKSRRKTAWLNLVRATGLLRDVMIHATGDAERDDIVAAKLRAQRIAVAPNLSPPIRPPTRPLRTDGVLRILFIGRISPVKNLDFALSVLSRVRVSVCFDIVGPVQDADYGARCRALAAALPPAIDVHWHGEISADKIPAHLVRAELMFLPSKSENFGHAIFEALACGTPVLIGQDTPWRDLAADGAGDDLPLDRPDLFINAIERVAARSSEAQATASAAAQARAARYIASSDADARHRTMILDALGQPTC